MIPSFEYNVLSTDQTLLLPIGQEVSVHIKGFGRIKKDHAVTVYAVVDSPLINGFNPHDIHGVKKDASTIFAR